MSSQLRSQLSQHRGSPFPPIPILIQMGRHITHPLSSVINAPHILHPFSRRSPPDRQVMAPLPSHCPQGTQGGALPAGPHPEMPPALAAGQDYNTVRVSAPRGISWLQGSPAARLRRLAECWVGLAVCDYILLLQPNCCPCAPQPCSA